MQFRHAYNQVRACKEVEWPGLAYSLGYTDQTYFIHDFKQHAGITPTGFFKSFCTV